VKKSDLVGVQTAVDQQITSQPPNAVRRAASLAEEALGSHDGKRPPIAVIAQYYFLAS
jgi:hypothetical protein